MCLNKCKNSKTVLRCTKISPVFTKGRFQPTSRLVVSAGDCLPYVKKFLEDQSYDNYKRGYDEPCITIAM